MSSLWKRLFEKWKKYQYEVRRTELKSSLAQTKTMASKKKRSRSKELQRAQTVSLIPVYRLLKDSVVESNQSSLVASRRGSLGAGIIEHEGARRDRPSTLDVAVLRADDTIAMGQPLSPMVTDSQPHPSQLFYNTPPATNMVHKDGDKKLQTRPRNITSGWTRLSRRLSQKDKIKERNRTYNIRQRSASIDCAEGRRLRHTADVYPSDNAAMTVSRELLDDMSQSPQSLPKSSPSPSSGSRSSELDIHKRERRRSGDRRVNTDITGLFNAVELQDMEHVTSFLATNNVDINAVNPDNLSVLDVAVLTNNIPIAKILLSYGAKQNLAYQSNASISDCLESLIAQAEKRVVDVTAAVLSTPAHVSVKENEKNLAHWQFRYRLLKRMKAGYDQSRVPDAPARLSLSVASGSSIVATFEEPLNHNGAVVTHYRVEWSCFEDFVPVTGEALIDDVQRLEYEITGLVTGNRYYVRVIACNMKGYGTYTYSQPLYAVPSSWRDIDGVRQRCYGKSKLLEELFSQLKHSRPSDAPQIKDHLVEPPESPAQRKRKSLKNLFTFAPKLQKSLKRGVYLACVFYNEDRLLVTAEDQLPMIEVDENFTGPSIQADFHWLMKISCTWEDIKSLKQDMARSGVTGTSVHVRFKILTAVLLLQNALGVRDLGRFYHRPVKDLSGCTVLATINYIREPKLINLISGKWLALSKLRRRFSVSGSSMTDARHIVLHALPDMLLYHQLSNVPLPPGLYMAYLKLQSSVDTIRVLVPHKTPNVLPHTRVRDCPNVNREEWEWIQQLSQGHTANIATPTQRAFHDDITKSCRRLINMLAVGKNNNEQVHRLYDLEVIELSPHVSFLLVLPPTEDVCVVPGQVDELTERSEYMTLPVQIFELIHMQTYHADIMKRYSRLSCIVDLDLYLTQQAHREAFSNDELSNAKERMDGLVSLQQSLDKVWKNTRWIMDVISYARDKSIKSRLTLDVLYDRQSSFSKLALYKDAENNNYNGGGGDGGKSYDGRCLNSHTKNLRITNFYDPNEESSRLSPSPSSSSQCASSASASPVPQRYPQSGILRVYAAYETGLAKGTSVKLHVTPRTTSREVINLVVQQLNKALMQKGRSDPVYGEEMLDQFCLVVIIGARERVLRDDYQPLQLQNPWTKGRLYVRLKCNVLAAIQQGHETYT